jgi:hypothetical protein
MHWSSIKLSDEVLAAVQQHLFGRGLDREQGGFLLCSSTGDGHELTFSANEWLPLMPEDYVHHEIDYLEMRDDVRAGLIKRAHDAAAALVEVHSHPWPKPAFFSEADLAGFAQFVPHVRWRLKRRPYGALVFGTNSFDGIAWQGDDPSAIPLHAIETPTTSQHATGLTHKFYGEIRHG